MKGTTYQRAAMTKKLMQHPKISAVQTKNHPIYLLDGFGNKDKIGENTVKFYAWAQALNYLDEKGWINIETGEVNL